MNEINNQTSHIRRLLLKLSLKKGFGPRSFMEIRNQVKNIPELIENPEILERLGKRDLYEYLIRDTKELDIYLEKLEKSGVKYLTLEDSAYPYFLKNIYDPPIIIYYKGSLEISDISFDTTISIVGSRTLDTYGINQTKYFSTNLADSGLIIVSGMAFGADAIAHQSSINTGKPTIAVLASGADVPTPSGNEKLYNSVLENGLIISEYVLGSIPVAGNFPARNRIVAGISKSTLVTQARKDSGSMITPNLAFNFGRDVFAIPGNLDNINHAGTNELIASGVAKLCSSPEDILKTSYDKKMIDNKVTRKIEFTNELQKSIYKQIQSGINSFHELISKLEYISPAELNTELSLMELNDVIKVIDQKIYVC